MNDSIRSPRRKLFWPSEARVRSVLEKIYDRVYAKVTLYDLVNPRFIDTGTKYLFSEREREYIFNSAHADFVIVDENDYPVLVIEVDGKSHQTQRQKERDALKDSILLKVNIPLVRLKSELFEKAQTQDEKLMREWNLSLSGPIQALVIGALSAMAHDSLILECARELYRILLNRSEDVDLLFWTTGVMKANNIRKFEKKWIDTVGQHDSVKELLPLINNSDEEPDLIYKLKQIGHKDWLARVLTLQRMDLMMIDRHIKSFINANGRFGGDIAAWYLIDETVCFTETKYLIQYCLLIQKVLTDFRSILEELIEEANETRGRLTTSVSDWLKKRTTSCIYILPWGEQTSLYTFYGFDRPGGGGITPLYDYLTDYDLPSTYRHGNTQPADDRSAALLISDMCGWLPEMKTIQESCHLVINVINETVEALSFFIRSYEATVSRVP